MSPRLHSEAARQRELYKYWQPNESVFPSADYDESFNHDYQPRPSYDSALTAYAQLGALRCNAKRGMISVVDQNFQYIIAEGTKTLSLQDGTVIDHDDELWFGLRTIPRQMGICATALGLFTTAEANDGSISDTLFQPLQFIIPDLSKDPRFEKQPFVCGVPYLRFYAGVPIRSPAGYIVGIYSIVDDKPRENFGEKDLNILKDLAATVMDHLVLGTVRGRHHRADRMVKGLGLFVEGKDTLRDWWLQSGHLAKGPTAKDGSRGEWTLNAQADAEFGPQVKDAFSNHAPREQKDTSTHCAQNPHDIIQDSLLGLVNPITPGSVPKSSPHPLRRTSTTDSANPNDNGSSSDSTAEMSSTSQASKDMLTRASNLIRESITVEGCLFLDASSASYKDSPTVADARHPESSTSSETEGTRTTTKKETTIDRDGRKPGSYHPVSSSVSLCTVLGCSLKYDPQQSSSETKARFRFPEDFLHRLITRYPSGGILNFEHDGSYSSSEEDMETSSSDNLLVVAGNLRLRREGSKSTLRELDAKIILDAFPGIRCLAFFPLRDTSTNSWFSGSFAWTKDPLRILDPVDDVAYLAAFGNSIMAEKAKLDTALADRMKGNFMSTVSHELRSPLHGILASAELLKDMLAVPAQIDLIGTINACGQILLDTINSVLDFTELNRLRKPNMSEQNTANDRDDVKKRAQLPHGLVNSIANVDLSKLTEEVIDGTLAGYGFSESKSPVIKSLDPQLPSSERDIRSQTNHSLIRTNGHLEVILDIDWRSDWIFAFQPGAWQRILTNLVSNALKYTKEGHIYISLRHHPAVPKQDSQPSVTLIVSDTGQGISKRFLKHHAFTPFMQEDSFARGTGLGLSIVKQIVHDLNGQIYIKSDKGAGTEVTVQIPLVMPISNGAPPKSIGDNEYLESVRNKMRGLRVSIISPKHSFDNGKYSPDSNKVAASRISEINAAAALSLEQSLSKTLLDWFELQIVEPSAIVTADADIYLLLEEGSDAVGTQGDRLPWTSEIMQLVMENKLIVLSTALASNGERGLGQLQSVQYIRQPFGPHKLARAFDIFSMQAMPTIQSSKINSLSTPTDNLQLNNVVPGSSIPDSSLLDSQTQEAYINGNSIMKPSADTAVSLPLLTKQPQLPAQSNSTMVLLVEDNEINLKLLIMYMRKLNYPYQTAVNGLEALQLYKKDPLPLRLILMDISMPIMDGLASTREIRRHERKHGIAPATIIALTGASTVDAKEQALQSGVDMFLTKPVPLNTVREIIAAQLPGSSCE